MLSLIQARGLTKWRGPRRVLDGLDLDVRQGEVLTILGPNGAGKSTLIGILAGLIRPDAGTVRLFGEDLGRLLPQVYARLGIALQLHGLSPRLTVRETVRFFLRFYRGGRPVDELLERFQLTEKQHVQTRRLSEGEKHRVSVALAFLKTFDIILLDEPMAGIDPEGKRIISEEIHHAQERGAAIIWATHLMRPAYHLSNRILVLQAGRQSALHDPQSLLEKIRGLDDAALTDDVFHLLTDGRIAS